MTYAERIIEQVKAKNAEQPEFIQAATEILGTLQPVTRRPSGVRGGRPA